MENNMNKFKVKVALLEKCGNIVDELNSSITYMQDEINEQETLAEEERGWRYDCAMQNKDKIIAYRQIISHLEKLL